MSLKCHKVPHFQTSQHITFSGISFRQWDDTARARDLRDGNEPQTVHHPQITHQEKKNLFATHSGKTSKTKFQNKMLVVQVSKHRDAVAQRLL